MSAANRGDFLASIANLLTETIYRLEEGRGFFVESRRETLDAIQGCVLEALETVMDLGQEEIAASRDGQRIRREDVAS